MTSFWSEYFSTFIDTYDSQQIGNQNRIFPITVFIYSQWNIYENDTLLANRNWKAQLKLMQIMNNLFYRRLRNFPWDPAELPELNPSSVCVSVFLVVYSRDRMSRSFLSIASPSWSNIARRIV